MVRSFTLYLLLLVAALPTFAQDVISDSITVQSDATESVEEEQKPHSPVRATIMSAALPGLGQVYNGKWWKVPIIYGGFGGLIYSSVINDIRRREFLNAYLARVDDDPNTVDDQFEGQYSDGNLRELADFYQRNRDLSIIFTGVLYALNIIDASVDAHLKDFDVSDDLTMKVRPSVQPMGPAMMPVPTLALTLRLK